MNRRTRQLDLEFRNHGGRRPGAGRKPAGARPGVPHRRREFHDHRHPVHVTMRVGRDLPSLRGRGVFAAVPKAINRVLARTGRVWSDRYHSRALRTPRDVRNGLIYVLLTPEASRERARDRYLLLGSVVPRMAPPPRTAG